MAKPKIKTMISLDPALKQKGDELVEKDVFPSFSAFITFLMKEYFRKKEQEAENKATADTVLQNLDARFPGMREEMERLSEKHFSEQMALANKFQQEFLENALTKVCGKNPRMRNSALQFLQCFGIGKPIDYPPTPQTPENTSPEVVPPET